MDRPGIPDDLSVLWAAVRREVEGRGVTAQAAVREMAESQLKPWHDQLKAEFDEALKEELARLPPEDRKDREALRTAERAEALLRQDFEIREAAAALEEAYLEEELRRVPVPDAQYAAEEQLAPRHLQEDAELLARHGRDLERHHAYWGQRGFARDDEWKTAGATLRYEDQEGRLLALHELELANIKARREGEIRRLGLDMQQAGERKTFVGEDAKSDRMRNALDRVRKDEAKRGRGDPDTGHQR